MADIERLAERLDLWATNEHHPQDVADLRAAATELRRLTAVDDRPAPVPQSLLDALDDMDPCLCAFCREVYCSGTHCIEGLDADNPEYEEKVERLQDLILVGRTVREWLSEHEVVGVPIVDDATRQEVEALCASLLDAGSDERICNAVDRARELLSAAYLVRTD